MSLDVDGSLADLSPELLRFLALEDDGDDNQLATLADGEQSALGELDITSTQLSLEGVGAELEQFADHEVLKAILDQGCDPHEYGRQYEALLRAAEVESIQDYITESDNLVKLHRQISTCDSILEQMESMLGRFQGDLGAISSEIRFLQDQSATMSVKLRNRKATQAQLGAFIDAIVVPAQLVEGIVAGEVDDAFLGHLRTLHDKLVFCETDKNAQGSAALQDVAPELQKLRAKAVAKSRDYLMGRIYALRKDKTNIQILQVNVLLKYKYLVTFLAQHGKEVFGEVRAAYIDTLSRVLSSKFRAYVLALEKLQVADVASAADLVGNPDGAASGVMAMFSRGPALHKADIFALRERGALLGQLDAPAIIPHIADSAGQKFTYEALFRSMNKLVLDTATSEDAFCSSFFEGDASVFGEVFKPTLALMEATLQAYLQETYDLVALLLMIRVNSAHRAAMGQRRIGVLDDYWDRLNLMLWPRLKALLDQQFASIRAFNPQQHPWSDLKVHYITERYAHLTASMLVLNSKDGVLDTNIDRSRAGLSELLLNLSRAFNQKKAANIFLTLNFSHVLAAVKEAAARVAAGAVGPPPEGAPLGTIGQTVIKELEEQLASCTQLYVEEVLTARFGKLVTFIKKAETAAKVKGVAADGAPVAGYGPAEAEPVVRDFSANWSTAIDALNKEVLRDFSGSAGVGREVLKSAMTQLLLYYTRLLELLKRAGPAGLALVKDAVTVPSIMYEIRRYNRG